jgi:DNA-binding transcriptional LysR family regulator
MRDIEIRHLRAFIAVAEELNYRKAALRLYIAQPALSRAIQQLELALGAQILERSTRVVRLTEIGRFLLEQARKIQDVLGGTVEAVHRMTLGQKGQLFVGFNDFTISEILPPIIHRFRYLFPEVEINLIDDSSSRMQQMVLERQLDIAFLSGVAPLPGLDSFLLREEKFVAVLPSGHRLAQRCRLNPRDLANEPFVLGVPGWSVFLEAVDAYCESAGFRPRVVQTAVHSNDIVNFVAAGIGVSIHVDRQWIQHRKDIAVRPMTGRRAKFRSLAIWRRGPPRSASLDKLIAIMRDVLGS